MQKLHVIYIPGLGDRKVTGQQRAIGIWRFWGVKPELFQMNWGDKEPWEPKFKRLLARIDALSSQGKSVGLVGVSAGASAVIHAYAARKDSLVGAVCIAGKINRPEAIGQRYRTNNPAFVTSANTCQQALLTLTPADRSRILSRFAVFDGVVAMQDSRVPHAHNRLSPTIGHVLTIALQITLGAPSFLHFLKHQARKLRESNL
jgi:dienelactone hydrolase